MPESIKYYIRNGIDKAYYKAYGFHGAEFAVKLEA